MERIKQFSDGIIDILVKVVFTCIAGLVTPLIISIYVKPLVYVWLALIALLVVLLLRDFKVYWNRPFSQRFRNEVEAMPKIKKIISKTKRKLCVLSKVGTSIFFSFLEYSKLLENDRAIQVLMVDPEDTDLIRLMDKIYVQQTEVKNRWRSMLREMQRQLEDLYDNDIIPQGPYKEINTLLNTDGGYRNVIYASIITWNLAETMAIARRRRAKKKGTIPGIKIKVYNVLPDIKAWITDDEWCALGHYDALHLGRDNPIDIYKPGRKRNAERWQFENVMAVWSYKFNQAREVDIQSASEKAEKKGQEEYQQIDNETKRKKEKGTGKKF
jgi:hypothetical protein